METLQVARTVDTSPLLTIVSKLAYTPKDVKVLLQEIVQVAAAQMKADNVTLHQYEPASRQFYDIEHSATFGAEKSLQRPREKGGASARVVESKNGVIRVADTATAEPELVLTRHVLEEDVRAYLGIRLQADEEIVGVVFFNYKKPREFSDEDIEHAKIFSNYASIAIRNARQLERLELLSRVGSRLASKVTDYQGLRKEVVTVVGQEMGASSVTLHEYDPIARHFYPLDRSFAYGSFSPLQRPRERGGYSSIVIEKGEYVVEDTGKEDPELFGTPHLAEVKAFLGIRLQVGEIILGVLFVNFRSPRRFSDEEQAIARTIANYVSIVILQQREQEKRVNEEKKAEIRRIVEQFAHAAINETSTARAAADKLNRNPSLNSRERKRIQERIILYIDSANRIIRELIEPIREEQPERLFLEDLIKKSLRHIEDPKHIDVKIGPLPRRPLFVDQRSILFVFDELVMNARKAIDRRKVPRGQIEILCKFSSRKRYIDVMFSNNGAPIREEYRNRIFKGIPVEPDDTRSLSGLGLSSIRGVMQGIGGDLVLLESNNIKTTFIARFPYSRMQSKE